MAPNQHWTKGTDLIPVHQALPLYPDEKTHAKGGRQPLTKEDTDPMEYKEKESTIPVRL